MTEYRGFTIDIIGTDIFVSHPDHGFALPVAKREGETFERCAKETIDRLLDFDTWYVAVPKP